MSEYSDIESLVESERDQRRHQASAAVYFLLAFLFVPIYGMLETTIPGSFVDNTLHTPMHWQQFVYYSLVTLSAAGFEATIGVLYVAILMARLVSLYDAQRRK
jgi:hypothetical protein